eukprot:CAMPEP_0205919710 /NCGR_PEP_ID=MMETSP1325-20131115/10614_1 /ASSEMBLY_ACC=CAM_ASM_000708 /TAXON_ID=236786 /ORGANISM="Florenciella sp., Strain RCC1007" /LENGTH=75 /DNA_ID=CAMNT_0053287345 /DNA_START=1 /DNA_END=224 /DNA_ORIENTATION=+
MAAGKLLDEGEGEGEDDGRHGPCYKEVNINTDFHLLPPAWQRENYLTAAACFDQMYASGRYFENQTLDDVEVHAA